MKESRYNVWVDRPDSTYVYNGVSGGVLELSREDAAAVRDALAGGSGAAPAGILGQLASGWMAVPDGTDELEILAKRYRASRVDRSTFGLTIVTSLGCNFDCPYCYEDKHASVMNADVRRHLLDIVDDQLPRISNLRVTWFGGEPLIGKRPLMLLSDAFIERCESHGVEYGASIITNGSLLDEKTCAMLRDRKVSSAQVTLDGPPDVHNRMRPAVDGGATFDGIVANLRHAVDYLGVAIRVNVDRSSFERVEELFEILVANGLGGRLVVYPGQIVATTENEAAPSTTYQEPCFTRPEFAAAEREFFAIAERYGFERPPLPRPVGTPCTAVRANELVVGSKGELYKCWESVGNPLDIIGHVRDYQDKGGRMRRWMEYDPFANEECRGCMALPVCMGGCAKHAMDAEQYENRCGTFRETYQERVEDFVTMAERAGGEGLQYSSQLVHQMETR